RLRTPGQGLPSLCSALLTCSRPPPTNTSRAGSAMKPRMKPDVYWTQVPEGVFLLGSPGQRTLKGRSLHRWIDRLAPHFDGSRTLEQIAGHLPRDQRDMVTRLVDVLTDAGYLVDASGDSPHDLSPAEVSAYGDMIAHIAYHRSSPERAFQDYRRSRLLIVGSGLTLRCLTDELGRAVGRARE